MSTQSPDDASRLSLPAALRPDLQRRREIALTARWLRELGGKSPLTGGARPAAQFTRPAKH